MQPILKRCEIWIKATVEDFDRLPEGGSRDLTIQTSEIRDNGGPQEKVETRSFAGPLKAHDER